MNKDYIKSSQSPFLQCQVEYSQLLQYRVKLLKINVRCRIL